MVVAVVAVVAAVAAVVVAVAAVVVAVVAVVVAVAAVVVAVAAVVVVELFSAAAGAGRLVAEAASSAEAHRGAATGSSSVGSRGGGSTATTSGSPPSGAPVNNLSEELGMAVRTGDCWAWLCALVTVPLQGAILNAHSTLNTHFTKVHPTSCTAPH